MTLFVKYFGKMATSIIGGMILMGTFFAFLAMFAIAFTVCLKAFLG